MTNEIDAAILLVRGHRTTEQDQRAVDVVETRERSIAIDLRETQSPGEVVERSTRRRHGDVARGTTAVLPGARRVVGAADDAKHSAVRLPEPRHLPEADVAGRADQLFFSSFASWACCNINRNICSRRKRF